VIPAAHPASRRAFTLIELITVVAIVGLIAATLAVSIGDQGSTLRRRAVGGVRDALILARVDAMRRVDPRTVTVSIADDRLVLDGGGGDGAPRSWRAPGLELAEEGLSKADADRLEDDGVLVAVYDTQGRTDQRVWTFDASAAGGTILSIRFDPVTSIPLVTEGERD